MTVPLSLDCLTLTDTSAPEVIRSAAAAGFDLVSLCFQHPPLFPALLVRPEEEAECAALLRDTGVGLHSVEFFDLTSEAALQAYRPALERGARLGGKAALAMQFTNPDQRHAAELLAMFAEVAAEYGLATNLEPVAMGRARTLADAAELIRLSGADVGILFDSWHLIRAGGSVEDLRAVDPALIRYAQFCDGSLSDPPADMIGESIGERLYPGDGDFPLRELLHALPPGIPLAIETPSLRRAGEGMSPRGQAIEAMAALRCLIA